MSVIQFASLEWGNSGNQAVVLLHGLYGHKEEWKKIAEALADDFYLIALDMPNHGDSAAMPSMSYGNMADAVATELKARGIKDAIFLAHSMSGRVSAILAQRQPELVKGLLILDAPPTGPFMPEDVKKDMLDSAVAIRESLDRKFENPEALREYMLGKVKEPMVVDYVSTHYSFGEKPGWHVGIEGIEAFTRQGVQEEVPGGVPCPYLMLKGGASPYSAQFTMEKLKAWKDDAEMVIIEGKGHFIHFQARKEVIERFREFAKRIV
ncbi:MAG: hypothetical protein CSA97_04375 [Bacteroidetes bacterium]|nr:MAG: hypothetical protein CSA97_04375 [Bacteroidota bacterium]